MNLNTNFLCHIEYNNEMTSQIKDIPIKFPNINRSEGLLIHYRERLNTN